MTGQAEIGETTPWQRLQRLAEMSHFEQDTYVKQWANELVDRHGAGGMPIYIWTAYRDTIAAVLLSLVDERAPIPHHGDPGGEGSSNGFAGSVSDAEPSDDHWDDVPSSDDRSDDVSPYVIRIWAQEKGISIGDRGRIPTWVVKRYQAEHAVKAERSLVYKIRAALEQYGELTKTELWDIVGRNQPSWKIEQAVESLPNVQMFKGESTGGRPPVIVRLVDDKSNEPAEPADVTVSGQLDANGSNGTEVPQDLAEAALHHSTTDAKMHDFLRILRGESSHG